MCLFVLAFFLNPWTSSSTRELGGWKTFLTSHPVRLFPWGARRMEAPRQTLAARREEGTLHQLQLRGEGGYDNNGEPLGNEVPRERPRASAGLLRWLQDYFSGSRAPACAAEAQPPPAPSLPQVPWWFLREFVGLWRNPKQPAGALGRQSSRQSPLWSGTTTFIVASRGYRAPPSTPAP